MTTDTLKRVNRLSVRFRSHEWELLLAAANTARQPVGEYARDVLNAVVRKVPVKDGTEDRVDK